MESFNRRIHWVWPDDLWRITKQWKYCPWQMSSINFRNCIRVLHSQLTRFLKTVGIIFNISYSYFTCTVDGLESGFLDKCFGWHQSIYCHTGASQNSSRRAGLNFIFLWMERNKGGVNYFKVKAASSVLFQSKLVLKKKKLEKEAFWIGILSKDSKEWRWFRWNRTWCSMRHTTLSENLYSSLL